MEVEVAIRRSSPLTVIGSSAPRSTRVSVTTNESFAGDPVSADVDGMRQQLDASLVAWLEYLKSAAEARG
jgi:hypothetical protein